jgi:hypothetical protein
LKQAWVRTGLTTNSNGPAERLRTTTAKNLSIASVVLGILLASDLKRIGWGFSIISGTSLGWDDVIMANTLRFWFSAF